MIKKKAFIYPYDSESTHFFRFNEMNKMYDVVGGVSPNGWGLRGKDVGSADAGHALNIKVKDKIEDTDEFDTLFLVDSKIELDFEKYIFPKLKQVVKTKKEIVNMRELTDEQIKQIIDLCKANNVGFKNILEKHYNLHEIKIIYDITVPVVFVAGISDRTNKFDIQLSLRKEFENMGYKVSQIGTKNHCELFGFHSFPSFMFENGTSNIEKIKKFNSFVKGIEVIEKPHVIIIGIPRSLAPMCKELPDDFGCTGFMVSRAVKPDAAIVSMMYNNYKADYFEEIQNLCKYRFDFEVDCFNIANNQIDYQDSKFFLNKLYTVIDSDYIDEKIKHYKATKPIYNVQNKEDRIKMASYLIDVLAGEEFIEDVL